MTTWTPHALASEAKAAAFEPWRVVESQHVASTMRLVDSLDEQAQLERLLDESKPKLLEGSEHLHYLLATPFRYRPRAGSRFRAPFDAGVWYGAEALRTALAEKSYWQLRFLLDSPGTPDLQAVPHTAFRASVRGVALDLIRDPLLQDRALWVDPRSYVATQNLAQAARAAGISLIRYESVRDPLRGTCVAVLVPTAFARSKPRGEEAWLIAASRMRVRCVRPARGAASFEFSAAELQATEP